MFAASLLNGPREGRNERRCHGPLGKEVPEEIGNPERDVVGVHRRARAEVGGENGFAGDGEDPAGEGGETDEARGSGQARAHRTLEAYHTHSGGAWRVRTVRIRKF